MNPNCLYKTGTRISSFDAKTRRVTRSAAIGGIQSLSYLLPRFCTRATNRLTEGFVLETQDALDVLMLECTIELIWSS